MIITISSSINSISISINRINISTVISVVIVIVVIFIITVVIIIITIDVMSIIVIVLVLLLLLISSLVGHHYSWALQKYVSATHIYKEVSVWQMLMQFNCCRTWQRDMWSTNSDMIFGYDALFIFADFGVYH